MFTPEELAEMAAADAEIEASFRRTNEELARSREADRSAKLDGMTLEKRKQAERQRAYREANRDKANEYQRAIRDARKAHGLTQQMLADKLGVSRGLVAMWETGAQRVNWELLVKFFPELEGYAV